MASGIDWLADTLGFGNSGATDRAKEELDAMLAQAQRTSVQNRGLVRDYYQQMNDIYGSGASKYSDAVAQLADAIANQGNYDKTVNDFYDPYANQREQAAMNAINNSAAAGGNRFSSNYIDKLAAKQQALASEEWQKSYDRLMRDREAQMSQWRANADNERANAAAADERVKAAMDIYGQGSEKADQAFADLIAGLVGNSQAQTQTDMDAVSGKTDLGMNQEKGVGGAASTIFKAIFG